MNNMPLSPHDVNVVVWELQYLRGDVDRLTQAVGHLTKALQKAGLLGDDVAGPIEALLTPPTEPYPAFSATGVRLIPADQVRQTVKDELVRLGHWAARFEQADDAE